MEATRLCCIRGWAAKQRCWAGRDLHTGEVPKKLLLTGPLPFRITAFPLPSREPSWVSTPFSTSRQGIWKQQPSNFDLLWIESCQFWCIPLFNRIRNWPFPLPTHVVRIGQDSLIPSQLPQNVCCRSEDSLGNCVCIHGAVTPHSQHPQCPHRSSEFMACVSFLTVLRMHTMEFLGPQPEGKYLENPYAPKRREKVIYTLCMHTWHLCVCWQAHVPWWIWQQYLLPVAFVSAQRTSSFPFPCSIGKMLPVDIFNIVKLKVCLIML